MTSDFARCYQIVACEDPKLLDAWSAAWADLIDFEFHPVLQSKDASAALEPKL